MKKIKATAAMFMVAGCFISSTVNSHEIGLQLYSLRHQFTADLPATFKQINDWGINVVEGGKMLAGYSVTDYKAELEKNNIELVSVDTDYDELRDNPIAVAYKAKFFGAKYATFYWIPHDPKTGFTFEHAKETVVMMNKAGKILKDNGITLQYHAHGYEFLPYGQGTIFDYMLKNTTQAQFQMDVFWVKQAGLNPTQLLQQYPGRFTSLHLKDRKKGSVNTNNGRADVETNVVLGQGDVGIESVVAEAKKQGIRYFFIEDESSRVMLQIPKSIEYLSSLDDR